MANAGSDQSLFKAAAVTLDGGASTDPDGHPLSYRWTQTAGAAVILSSTSASRPSFTAPTTSGSLSFSLVVNDGRVDSAADAVQVNITNRAPVANAGADGEVNGGALYTLDALGSADPDSSDTLNFDWVQLSGPPVTLTPIGLGRVRFTAPMSNAQLDFAVTASDGEALSAQDTVSVQVASVIGNEPPSVYLDSAYTVAKRSLVNITGYGFDPEGSPLIYQWTQVGGPTVTLTGATTPDVSFSAPSSPATLEFELTVSDGELTSAPGHIAITVQNFAPCSRGWTSRRVLRARSMS